MTPDEIRSIVRDELASLGGHLLSIYSHPIEGGAEGEVLNHELATLGGYILAHYGPDKDAGHVAYRDPEPPAVGEPPTTTPGDGAAFTENATVTKTDATP